MVAVYERWERWEMNWLWFVSEFLRKVRYEMRFGELSRAPLKLLRLELCEHSAECEWLARESDPWDRELPVGIREQNQTFQALHDAIAIRELLFSSIPEIRLAEVCVYRQSPPDSRELIITGSVNREDAPPPRVSSLVMRAKLYGLNFRLEEEALGRLDRDLEAPIFAIASHHGEA
jgi:hypothetical protein